MSPKLDGERRAVAVRVRAAGRPAPDHWPDSSFDSTDSRMFVMVAFTRIIRDCARR